MSTLPAEQFEAAPAIPALGGARARAGVTVGAHSVTDFFSAVTISLIPLLTARLDLTTSQVALLLGVGSVTSGLIQPLTAWASDKLDTRALGTIGLAVAVVCVSLIGRARSFEVLLLLHGTGAAGIGAFHPPAAAAVGHLSGAKRSLGVAVFFLAGMVGGVSGNVFVPRIVNAMAGEGGPRGIDHGLASLTWLMIPGLVAVVVLAMAIHPVPHRHHDAHETHGRLTARERRERWWAVGLLYAGNVMRFSVNMALVYLFAQWAQAHTLDVRDLDELTRTAGLRASELNGPLQGMMPVGMGIGGITLGFLLAPRFEKLVFVVAPLVGAGAIALIPLAGGLPTGAVVPVVLTLAVLTGVGFGGVVPVSVSLAQRLLPHRTSLASG
ncbi:MAG: MFS transporter [Phycisphaerales bacterium]